MSKNVKAIRGNPEYIRKINRSLIIKTIMENGVISRSELAVRTSLALPTIMRIVSILVEEGLVVEVGKGDSSGGRKPTMLRMNAMSMYFVGVTIQSTMQVVLADISGNVVSSSVCDLDPKYKPDSVLNLIVGEVETLASQRGIPLAKIKYAGIGMPGTGFKHSGGQSNFPFAVWKDFDYGQWQNTGRLPFPVELENVAKLGALGELMFGNAKNHRNFIYVFAGHGIGAGVVIDGNFFKGADGVAGEFGHTIVKLGDRPCYCGNIGCIETYCSTNAVIAQYIDSVHADNALKGMLAVSPNFSLLASAAYSGDMFALKCIEDSARMLGIGVGGLINLFNPSLIVIGGELVESCAGYTSLVAEAARANIFRNSATKLEIIPGKLNDQASVMGAIALAMSKVFDHVLMYQ